MFFFVTFQCLLLISKDLIKYARVGFSHLKEHKFRHNFQDTINPFCDCSTNSIDTTEHYLLQCSNHLTQRSRLFDDLNKAFTSLILFRLYMFN